MADGFETSIAPCFPAGLAFIEDIARYVGETVTIFTTSGGESGSGFTGVLSLVTPEYVRLITAIGTPPECSLGNGCDFLGKFGGRFFGRRSPFFGLGSVVDIPVARIAGFVHNTL